VLSNHDVVRQVTRYARTQATALVESDEERARWATEEPDLDLGRRRARAAAMLMLALPGSAYVYQGEELGLPEVEDVPDDRRQDPVWRQSGHQDVGRDGCRVPLPWTGEAPPYGFSPDGAGTEPWLPQPQGWGGLTAAAQHGDPASVLELYRRALRLRREHLLDAPAEVVWLDAPTEVLAFRRGDWQCWVNTGDEEVGLPAGEVVLCSDPDAVPGRLPGAAAAWVRGG
jgi:alpha-glucosidase